MPHFAGENDAAPVSAILMTAAQVEEIEALLANLLAPRTATPVVFSEEQFQKLVSLLQPGFELSTRMLADYNRQAGPVVHTPPPTPIDTQKDAEADAEADAQPDAEPTP